MADPDALAHVSELCAAYRRILDTESNLLQALKRIRELEDALKDKLIGHEIGQADPDEFDAFVVEAIEGPHLKTLKTSTTGKDEREVARRVLSVPPDDKLIVKVKESDNWIARKEEDGFEVLIRSSDPQAHNSRRLVHRHVEHPHAAPLKTLDPNIPQQVRSTPVMVKQSSALTPGGSVVRFDNSPQVLEFTPERQLRPKKNEWSSSSPAKSLGTKSTSTKRAGGTPNSGNRAIQLYQNDNPTPRRSEPRVQSDRPPFIPGGGDTFFNIHSVRQKRDRERFEDSALKQPRHRGIVQQLHS